MLFGLGVVLVLFCAFSTVLSVPTILTENDIEVQKDLPVNYRLPNNTIPESYTVELTTNVHLGQRDFKGIVQIDLKVIKTTSTITIHARELNGFKAKIHRTDKKSSTSHTLTTDYVLETEFLNLFAKGLEFPKGSKWKLTITYQGELRTDNAGFYITSFQDEQNNTRFLATTQFEETDARHAFPCYDEPAKRANFTFKINHDPSYTALSNMPVDTAKSSPGHTVFQTLKSSSTYLLALVVSDMNSTKGELDLLPQRVFSRTGTEGDRELALMTGMLTMNRLKTYTKVDFPLKKQDMVVIPDFISAGMENWGLTLYHEDYLLYKTKTVFFQNLIAKTIAHENTHQWFGNLVAIKWWSYLWLKEGLATLFEFEMTSASYPEWDYNQIWFVDHYMTTLSSDATVNSRPMTYYIETPAQISILYDYIPYSKAAAVLFMWQNALTDTVFQKGLYNYLDINKYSAADEDDLFEAIQIAVDQQKFPLVASVKDMMGSWTQQGNYPLLTVTRDYGKGTFNVTQKVYYKNVNLTSDKTYYVPFNFATKLNPDFRETVATHYLPKSTYLGVNDVNISKNHWIILNKQSTGLYRINYDNENWNLIIEQLLQAPYRIHTHNRAQLLSDAYYFSTSNRLDYLVLIKMMVYLSAEDQYAPWFVANMVINDLKPYFLTDTKYPKFQKFIAKLTEKTYLRLGPNELPGKQHLEPLVRSIVVNLACLAGVDSCLSDLTRKISDSINKNISIEQNLIEVAFCNGLRRADDNTFNGVYNLLMKTESQTLRRTLINALGCSESPDQIKKFIESSIDMSNNLTADERTSLLYPSIYSSSVGIEQSIQFLEKNWDEYAALSIDFNLAENDLLNISYNLVNEELIGKLKTLINTVRSKLAADTESKALANINYNIKWMKDHGNPIIEFMNTQID